MNGGRTWWFDSGGLVSWNYRPMARSDGRLVPQDLEEAETRRRWLCDLVSRLPALLGDFAYLTDVRVNARGKGTGACVIDWRDREGPSTLLTFLQQAETWGVEAHLNLTCLDRDLKSVEIMNGAVLWVKIRLTESGSLDWRTDAPVYIHLNLNADIYAPWSIGEIQDNALLASLNGPRLAGFLERIERDVPAELLEINPDHHSPETVGPRGFIAPPGGFKDA